MTFCAFALVLALGCDQQDGSAASGGSEAPSPAGAAPPPLPPPDPGDAVGVRLHQVASRFAQHMVPSGPATRGTLETGGVEDLQVVLTAGHCYRVIGAGGDGVEDLDLFLFDPDSVPLQQDTAVDPVPVLGLSQPICPETNGAFRVQVRMFAGRGDFAVQVFQSQ